MRSPVHDATGLNGKYDFDLKVGDRAANDHPEENPLAWPQMPDALQRQLGQRLEAAQIMQKALVIDHLEAASSKLQLEMMGCCCLRPLWTDQ